MNTGQPPTGVTTPRRDPRQRISALTPAQLTMLKDLYQYYSLKQKVAGTGWLNVILGALTIWLGLSHTQVDLVAIIQTLIGCLIVGVSLWAVIAPSARVLLLYSVLFAVCGPWNILIPIRVGFDTIPLLAGLLGILQLFWATQYYKFYKEALQAPFAPPTPEAIGLYSRIWSEMVTSTSRDESDYIELKLRGKLWRGLLMDKLAAFAEDRRTMLILADRSNVTFTPNNPGSGSREYPGKLSVHSTTLPAVLPRLTFERFTRWKGSPHT